MSFIIKVDSLGFFLGFNKKESMAIFSECDPLGLDEVMQYDTMDDAKYCIQSELNIKSSKYEIIEIELLENERPDVFWLRDHDLLEEGADWTAVVCSLLEMNERFSLDLIEEGMTIDEHPDVPDYLQWTPSPHLSSYDIKSIFYA